MVRAGSRNAQPTANNMRAAPNGQDFAYGAENLLGQGDVILNTLPTADQRVTSTAPTAGGSYTYSVTLKATKVGDGVLHLVHDRRWPPRHDDRQDRSDGHSLTD
jgi:hypothetical protein